MATPMQELIDEMQKSPLMFASALTLIEEMRMLEKEKEVMCEFQELAQRTDFWVEYDGSEDCFEKTFNTKEK